MKKQLICAGVISSMFLLNACVVAVNDTQTSKKYKKAQKEDKELKNRKAISMLNTSMTVSDVQTIMGVADFNEFYLSGTSKKQVLFYKTHTVKNNGVITKNECTPLIFNDGVLTSWGSEPYQAITK